MFFMFAKNEWDDLSSAQRQTLRQIVEDEYPCKRNCSTNASQACAKVARCYAAKPSRLGLAQSKGRLSNISAQPNQRLQGQCAALLGISVATLRNCEQGRRTPAGPARVLLQGAVRHPNAAWDVVRPPTRRRQSEASLWIKRSIKTPKHRLHSTPNQGVEPTAQMVSWWHAGAV